MTNNYYSCTVNEISFLQDVYICFKNVFPTK